MRDHQYRLSPGLPEQAVQPAAVQAKSHRPPRFAHVIVLVLLLVAAGVWWLQPTGWVPPWAPPVAPKPLPIAARIAVTEEGSDSCSMAATVVTIATIQAVEEAANDFMYSFAYVQAPREDRARAAVALLFDLSA